jgi:MFS family permease
MRAALGVGDAAIGASLAGVAIGSIAGLAASPGLLAWLGNRRAILFDLALVTVGVAGIGVGAGVAHSLALATAGFAVLGFGIGLLDVMINVEGSAVERAFGRTLMPLMHGGWSAGAVLGAGIGAAAVALHVAFLWQFVGEAIAIAIAAVVVLRFLPHANHAPAPVESRSLAERVTLWVAGWKNGKLLLIGLVMLGVELGEGTANSWLTLDAKDGHGLTSSVAALFFVAFTAGETTARIFGGPIVDRIGRVAAVRVTTAIGVVGVLLFLLPGPPWSILVGAVLWAVGVSMGFPLGMSAAADSGPNPAAQVRVVASIGYLANLGGPPVIGALSEHFGALGALWLVIILLAIGCAAAGALATRRTAGTGSDSAPIAG